MDVFSNHGYSPMLISRESEPFDDPDWVFELKLDGIRCLAYLNEHDTTLIGRSHRDLTSQFPELSELHDQASCRCVIDGELVLLEDGVPSFKRIMERALAKRTDYLMHTPQTSPAVFVVYDILYVGDEDITELPLVQRRHHLEHAVNENERMTLSRQVPERGIEFFNVIVEKGLEGIIGKHNDSLYLPGKRTSEWVKIKNVHDDDFIICGYLTSSKGVSSLILGQYTDTDELMYAGHVVIDKRSQDFERIQSLKHVPRHVFSAPIPKSNDGVTWVELKLVCTVEFLSRTESGATRHPVYKGLRIDKVPEDARFISH